MITCQQLTELVSPYLEDTLDPAERERLEAHLAACAHCVMHVEQLRATIVICGHVETETLTPGAREDLAAAFRAWRSAS